VAGRPPSTGWNVTMPDSASSPSTVTVPVTTESYSYAGPPQPQAISKYMPSAMPTRFRLFPSIAFSPLLLKRHGLAAAACREPAINIVVDAFVDEVHGTVGHY